MNVFDICVSGGEPVATRRRTHIHKIKVRADTLHRLRLEGDLKTKAYYQASEAFACDLYTCTYTLDTCLYI